MTGVIVVRHEADSLKDFGEFLSRHMDPILPFSMMGFNRENLDDTSFGIMVYRGSRSSTAPRSTRWTLTPASRASACRPSGA